MLRSTFALLAVVATASAAAAQLPPTYAALPDGPSILLANANGLNAYTGVVRYNGRASCTAVFVAPPPSVVDPADAPAYALTNGHCPAFPGSNDVLLDQGTRGRVTFEFFADTVSRQYAVDVRHVTYATMKGRDLAILELDARVGELTGRGYLPWRIASADPAPDDPVVVVGAPLQRTPATSFLRLARCALEGRADTVVEFSWTWHDSWRLGCEDIAPGSSGSPVISLVSRRLVALVNTTTRGAVEYSECGLDHPCEPAGAEDVSWEDTSYATPLTGVNACFDLDGRFDVSAERCPLDPGVQARVTPARLGYVNPSVRPLDGRPLRNRWDVAVGGHDYYRYKVVNLAGDACRNPKGYGQTRRVLDSPRIDDALPSGDGWYHLCVIAGDTSAWTSGWQRPEHATAVSARIDTVAPRIPPLVQIEDNPTAWVLAFSSLDPEVSVHVFKFGPPATTRCGDPADYRPTLVPFYALPKAGRPYTVCIIPVDAAGNGGPPFEQVLP